jgi:hypothetical protein
MTYTPDRYITSPHRQGLKRENARRNVFRGKGCLYGCLGAFAAAMITVLGVVGFGLYKVRGYCFEYTVSLSQAKEICKLTNYDATGVEQPEKIQELLRRLKSLSHTPGNDVQLSASEVQTLINHIVSLPLSNPLTDAAPIIAQMGFFAETWMPKPITKVSISKDAITLCAVSAIDDSLLSWCPATGERGVATQATLIPSMEIPGQPLAIADAQLNDTKVQSADFSSFQRGLYAMLTASDEYTNSDLLQTLTQKIEKITLEDGSLTLHPRRSPNDSGSAQ